MSSSTRFWQSLARGEIARGWWQPPVDNLHAMPVLAARGQHSGPTTVITGAVHGDEYEGPAAIHALFRTLDTDRLAGLVIGLPVVHVAAWEARSRTSPLDGLDLNRLFPSAQGATEPSRILAETIFENFVAPCDVLIDLHSGGAKLVHLPMIGWYEDSENGDSGNRNSGEGERLARSFAQTMHPWRPGTVAGVFSQEAHRAGKIALGAEWGGGAALDRVGAATYATGLRRTLAHLAGESPEPHFYDRRAPLKGVYLATAQGGLFVADVQLGDHVEEGTMLGRLYNPLGEEVGTIQTERAGTVAALAHGALLSPGDRMAYIG